MATMKTESFFATYKRYLIFLGILIILTPIGIFLPEIFKAGDAWGEWSIETVKKLTGHEPEGMKKAAELYSAPIPDYNPGKKNDTLSKQSVGYIISGAVGVGIILLLTFGATKLINRNKIE
jgi:cobalt/nickel transport protein